VDLLHVDGGACDSFRQRAVGAGAPGLRDPMILPQEGDPATVGSPDWSDHNRISGSDDAYTTVARRPGHDEIAALVDQAQRRRSAPVHDEHAKAVAVRRYIRLSDLNGNHAPVGRYGNWAFCSDRTGIAKISKFYQICGRDGPVLLHGHCRRRRELGATRARLCNAASERSRCVRHRKAEEEKESH
jgi:hypothetical protein